MEMASLDAEGGMLAGGADGLPRINRMSLVDIYVNPP